MKKNRYEHLKGVIENKDDEIHQFRQAIINFCTVAKATVISGSTKLGDLYRQYEMMKPSLHKRCGFNDPIDLNAFSYALQRLPEEISGANTVFIKSTPDPVNDIDGIKVLKCKARRRTVTECGEGYIKMVAREGETDIFDILTSLIMYGIESQKISGLLRQDGLYNEISGLVDVTESPGKNRVLDKLANLFSVGYDKIYSVDTALDHSLFRILKNVVSHNDAAGLKIYFDKEFSVTGTSQKVKNWIGKIKTELREYGPRPIILISSDRHSIVNCLTGFTRDYEDEIQRAARDYEDLQGVDGPSGLYYIAQELFKRNPDFGQRKFDYESALGIKFIKDEFHTGIDVQVIDTGNIDYSKVDSRLNINSDSLRARVPLILNLDYAFGKEGYYIMRELCEAFGERIESVSVTGKAGILCGDKYDIMLPTSIIPQIAGGIYNFPRRKNYLRPDNFDGIVDGLNIHTGGPMLTVPGTAIQNDLVLFDYMYRYGILGLEMEAAPYFDAVEKACERGLLRNNIMVNVAYWGSDNPLKPNETLAENHMEKGFKPVYSIILAMLNNVLNYKK